MIRRERGKFTLTCDGCGLFNQDERWRPNKEAWSQAQREGWTSQSVNDGKEWRHFCPGCLEKANAA